MQTNLAIISTRFKQTRERLPHQIGALMIQFTATRFSEQGWVNDYSLPWQRRKGNKDPGRAILIKTGALKRSIRVISVTPTSVTIGSDVPYAKYNNDGFRGRVQVAAHIRTRKLSVRKKIVKNKKMKAEAYKYIGPINVRPHDMHMNLPRRQFMGESAYLTLQVRRLITAEVNKCFK